MAIFNRNKVPQILFLAAGLFAASCKKTTSIPVLNKELVVLFDDENANPGLTSFSPAITAAPGRLFMTYAHASENGSLNDEKIQTFYIVSDNHGKLIKMGNIPAPSFAFNSVAGPDGNFHVIVGDFNKTDRLRIYHYDNNGNYTGKDSVMIKNGFSFNSVLLSPKGQFVLRNWNPNTPSQINQFQEIDFRGNVKWTKIFNFHANQAPVSATEDGFIFTTNNTTDSVITVVKYTEKFDTAWVKNYRFKPGFRYSYSYMPLPFRNKLLIRITEYSKPGLVTATPNLRRFNFFISDNGDSLGIVKQSGVISNPNGNSILRLNNGNIFYTARYNNVSEYDMFLNASEMFSEIQVVNEQLHVVRKQLIQNQTTDFLVSACLTSENQIACFGLQQIFKSTKYKPELLLLNE